MPTVAEHYQQFLAEHYVWMSGGSFEQKVAEQKAVLHSLGALSQGAAVDLGSGPGFQSVALAELGFCPVIAVDSSRELLLELTAHIGSHPIETIQADITAVESIAWPQEPAVVVCMGDTLTHLPSKLAVQDLFAAMWQKLAPQGMFVITYRDLSFELIGLDRFLPVRADETKIFTCFLEYSSDERVTVHDLLYRKEREAWRLEKSCYQKCRLARAWVTTALRAAGFAIERDEAHGSMLLIAGRKTA